MVAALASLARTARADERLVDITSVSPEIHVDLRYATKDNIVGKAMYARDRCFLREPVARRVAAVEVALRKRGLGLLLWDCYRPRSVQAQLWAIQPDPRYVADPKKGSRHNRGAAVDLTLIDKEGKPLSMPTAFDDASERSHRNAVVPPELAAHRKQLEVAMTAQGFLPLPTEWWHFDDGKWKEYPLADASLESLADQKR